jgi:hypothetical protein
MARQQVRGIERQDTPQKALSMGELDEFVEVCCNCKRVYQLLSSAFVLTDLLRSWGNCSEGGLDPFSRRQTDNRGKQVAQGGVLWEGKIFPMGKKKEKCRVSITIQVVYCINYYIVYILREIFDSVLRRFYYQTLIVLQRAAACSTKLGT